MALCEHGYTAFYDCPQCACPRCAQPMADCNCGQEEEAARLAELNRIRQLAGEVA